MQKMLWTILRCHSNVTISLVNALLEGQAVAWTPIEVKQVRLPRKRIYVTTERPLLPSLVFLHYKDLGRAKHLLEYRQVPKFKVFMMNGQEALVEDYELQELRDYDPEIKQGDLCVVSSGSFVDRKCTILVPLGKYCIVRFQDAKIEVKISTFLLRRIQAYAKSEQRAGGLLA
jgi:hypothetical protein